MQRRKLSTWEANHPLNGNPCPVTNRLVYIEDTWKITRADYRLRTGILEPGIVLSLPVGHTSIDDTATFFVNMHDILGNSRLDAGKFVLVEDYTLHTGSDYEGRRTYIRRMIDEIHPAAIIFIARSTSWRLSIKIGTVLYGSPFPIILAPSYRDALRSASEILGRPLEGQTPVKTYDKIDHPNFSISLGVLSPTLLHVKFSGCPSKNDLSSIADFYLGLPYHPKVTKEFRTIHDFSAMAFPSLHIAVKIFRLVLSRHYNSGDDIAIVEGASPGVAATIRLIGMFKIRKRRIAFYKDLGAAIANMRPDVEIMPVFRENIKTAALELLETIVWNKPGFDYLETVIDPLLKPLALTLGSIKQDIDYYLQQRQNDLDKLEELNRHARQLSRDIEQALHRSEDDCRKAEILSKENLSLSKDITASQKEVFLVLADYIDRRALVPAGSTRKLARLAKKTAVLFGYGEEDRDRLHDATLLIHTGYLAIPEQERNPDLHCVFGGDVLGKIHTFIMQYASDIARYHHEKWDGSGFPEHLKGELIPPEARLIAIADFLLSRPQDQIEDALRSESGKAFDPVMVANVLHNIADVKAFIA
jgi:response regulator RpfG family c-di-GMP phosphodiesterase